MPTHLMDAGSPAAYTVVHRKSRVNGPGFRSLQLATYHACVLCRTASRRSPQEFGLSWPNSGSSGAVIPEYSDLYHMQPRRLTLGTHNVGSTLSIVKPIYLRGVQMAQGP